MDSNQNIVFKKFLNPNSTRIYEDGKRFKSNIDELSLKKPLISLWICKK